MTDGTRPEYDEDPIEAMKASLVMGLIFPLVGPIFGLLFAHAAGPDIREDDERAGRFFFAALVTNYLLLAAEITGLVLIGLLVHSSGPQPLYPNPALDGSGSGELILRAVSAAIM